MRESGRILFIATLACFVLFCLSFLPIRDLDATIGKILFGVLTGILLYFTVIVYFSSVDELKKRLGNLLVELAAIPKNDFDKYKSTREQFDKRVNMALKNFFELANDYKATSLNKNDKDSRLEKLREIIGKVG
jgi:hypothetical protein